MQQMESVDANLLLALEALLQAGSVTGAARRMNVSPPATACHGQDLTAKN